MEIFPHQSSSKFATHCQQLFICTGKSVDLGYMVHIIKEELFLCHICTHKMLFLPLFLAQRRSLEYNIADVDSIISLIPEEWLWRVTAGWLGRRVITGVISEVELKGVLLDWWLFFQEGHGCQILGCFDLSPFQASVPAFGPGREASVSISLFSWSTLLPSNLSVLSKWSSALLSVSVFRTSHPSFSLAWLIMNEEDHLSIPSSVLALQKISNLLGDL